jgi:type IV secretory pathway VirB2 component (pilin)
MNFHYSDTCISIDKTKEDAVDRKTIVTVAAVSFAIMLLMQGDLLAQTTVTDANLDKKLTSIRDFIYGTPMKIAAVMGAVAGGLKSYAAGSATPFLIYSGIALGAGLAPTLLDSIFTVSGMLLK